MFNPIAWLSVSTDALAGLGYVVQLPLWTGGALLLGWPTGAIRYIDNSRVGIVEKLFSLRGSVRSGLIATSEEAGYQPDVLRGGLHFMMPFQCCWRIAPASR